jgi:hypothetical protein
MKKTTIRKGFLLSEDIVRKLQEIQEHISSKTETTALEYSIHMCHEKIFNNYVAVAKSRAPREVLSPEERADRDAKNDVALKDRKVQLLIEAGTERAKLLGASIETLPNGSQFATWKVYAKETPRYVSVGELGKNITEITDLDVTSQYRGGTREELEAILNAG